MIECIVKKCTRPRHESEKLRLIVCAEHYSSLRIVLKPGDMLCGYTKCNKPRSTGRDSEGSYYSALCKEHAIKPPKKEKKKHGNTKKAK